MSSDPKAIAAPTSPNVALLLGDEGYPVDDPARLVRNSVHLNALHDVLVEKIEELEHQETTLGEHLDSEGLRAGRARHRDRLDKLRTLKDAVKKEAEGDFQRAVLLRELQVFLDELILAGEELLMAEEALNGPLGATRNRWNIVQAVRAEAKLRIDAFVEDPLNQIPDHGLDAPDADTDPAPSRRERSLEPSYEAKRAKTEPEPLGDETGHDGAAVPVVEQPPQDTAGEATGGQNDPFEQHAAAWPSQHDSNPEGTQEPQALATGDSERPGAGHANHAPQTSLGETVAHPEAGGCTEAQGAHAPVQDAPTSVQGATDGGPDTLNVEYTDTANQAGAAQMAMNTNLGLGDTDYRPPSTQRVRDESFGELPAPPAPSTDPESVVAALCQQYADVVRNQASGLAQEGEPLEVAILVEENDDGDTVYRFHTNAGFGVNSPGVHTPDICEPGFETAVGLVLVGPSGQRVSALQAVVGLESAAEVAVRDFQFRQELDKREGKRRALIGIGSTGPILVEVRRAAVDTLNHVLGEPPPSPFFVDGPGFAGGIGLADRQANADPALLAVRHPLYRAAEGLNPYRGTDRLAKKLEKAVRWWDARTLTDASGRGSWHVQVEFAARLVDDICVAAEVRDRQGVRDALLAVSQWRPPDTPALARDLAAWLPPLWAAVRRERDKKMWERQPFDVIRPYRSVLAGWAFTALLAEYKRGWSGAESDPWWLHTICHLHLKAHNDQYGKLDERIPDYPDDIYAN